MSSKHFGGGPLSCFSSARLYSLTDISTVACLNVVLAVAIIDRRLPGSSWFSRGTGRAGVLEARCRTLGWVEP